MSTTYTKPKSGEWVQPVKRGYKMACCDCGLVHRINFRVIDSKTGKLVSGVKTQFQAYRHSRATAGMRAAKTRLKKK